ncbi:YdfR family protein, partial [Escherichia coli]|uniref:YdfR family protein n=1 Tax=Escherichia coli TaxID=562 RepID=UPI0021C001CD
MDSVHHIWCPLFSQEFQDLPDGAETTLTVKGINNYPNKITVTVALEIGGYPSLLLPDVAISLDRT